MHPRWEALHDALARDIASPKTQQEWERLAVASPALSFFRRPADVLTALAPGEPSPEELDRKDELLLALVRAVQQGIGPSRVATVLLWLTLWRALAGLLRHHAKGVRDPEEAVSELADRFTFVVRHLRIDHVRRVAVTLLRNTKRELQAVRRARAAIWARELPLVGADGPPADENTVRRLELRLMLETAGDRRTVGMLLGALAGMTAHEIASAFDASAAAVQKHMRRALQRLGRRAAMEIEELDVRFPGPGPREERCGSDARGRSEMAELKIDNPHGDPRFYDEYLRLPGLFRRWELEQIVDVDCEYRFEDAGLALDGSRLIAVYRRDLKARAAAGASR